MFFFRNYKTVIFIVILLAVVLIFLAYNFKQKSPAGLVTKSVLEVAAPVQHGLNASVKSVIDSWHRYLYLVGMEEENRNLRKKIDDLKSAIEFISGGSS